MSSISKFPKLHVSEVLMHRNELLAWCLRCMEECDVIEYSYYKYIYSLLADDMLALAIVPLILYSDYVLEDIHRDYVLSEDTREIPCHSVKTSNMELQ
jgi:hypothetical protein